MRLREKVIVVTASTRGIGLAIAQLCLREGANVYLAVRDLARGEALLASLGEGGSRARCVYCDATRPETFRSMVEETLRQAGRLDGLVNNFGSSDPKKDLDLLSTHPDEFRSIVERNLMSVFLASQAAAEHMDFGGSIVNISSVGGSVPDISQIAYGTSKAAINHLTRIMAVQLAAKNIRCNAVLPGMTATDSVERGLSPSFRSTFLRHIPLGRMGLPMEMAEAVVYFLSDAAAYATGQLLTLSGGFGLATPLYGDLSTQLHHR